MIAATDGDPARGDLLAAGLLAAIRSCESAPDTPKVALTASAGIAAISVGSSLASTLEAADQALYRAKETGRDRAARAELQPVEEARERVG